MDKVLELALLAGLDSVNGKVYTWAGQHNVTEELEKFYTLARADLEAEIFRLREHIIDQTKLEQEIAQLRKERQAFKDVTEYQKAENAKLREALENCMNILEVEVFRGIAYQAASAALGEK